MSSSIFPAIVATSVSSLLRSLGQDPETPALKDTPMRVAKAWAEMLSGYDLTAADILKTEFDAEHDEVVLCRNITFWSTCEHHLLPFHGVAHVGYVPENNQVVGLSKLARLVEMHARRLQLQERMTQDIATDLMQHVKARGVVVVVRASHLCMAARGVKQQTSELVTSVMKGCFRDQPAARAEALALIGGV